MTCCSSPAGEHRPEEHPAGGVQQPPSEPPEPHGRHVGARDQPADPHSRAEPETERGGGPGETGPGPAAAWAPLTVVLSPDAEPHVPDGDPAAGELPLDQQAGEGAAAADVRAQPAPSPEQVSPAPPAGSARLAQLFRSSPTLRVSCSAPSNRSFATMFTCQHLSPRDT